LSRVRHLNPAVAQPEQYIIASNSLNSHVASKRVEQFDDRLPCRAAHCAIGEQRRAKRFGNKHHHDLRQNISIWLRGGVEQAEVEGPLRLFFGCASAR
jgi:hypothetical protein